MSRKFFQLDVGAVAMTCGAKSMWVSFPMDLTHAGRWLEIDLPIKDDPRWVYLLQGSRGYGFVVEFKTGGRWSGVVEWFEGEPIFCGWLDLGKKTEALYKQGPQQEETHK